MTYETLITYSKLLHSTPFKTFNTWKLYLKFCSLNSYYILEIRSRINIKKEFSFGVLYSILSSLGVLRTIQVAKRTQVHKLQ